MSTKYTLIRNEDDRSPVVTQVVFPEHPVTDDLWWHISGAVIGRVLKHVIDLPWEGKITMYREDQHSNGVGEFRFEARVEAYLNDAVAEELVIEFEAKTDDKTIRGMVCTKAQSQVPVVGYVPPDSENQRYVIGFINETTVAIHKATKTSERWSIAEGEPTFNLTTPHEACALLRGVLNQSTPLSPSTGSDDLIETEEAGREYEE